MADLQRPRISVKIDGKEHAPSVQSFAVVADLREPAVTVDLAIEDLLKAKGSQVRRGLPLTVVWGYSDASMIELFQGVVRDVDGARSPLQVKGIDFNTILAAKRITATYQDETAEGIVRAILADTGLTVGAAESGVLIDRQPLFNVTLREAVDTVTAMVRKRSGESWYDYIRDGVLHWGPLNPELEPSHAFRTGIDILSLQRSSAGLTSLTSLIRSGADRADRCRRRRPLLRHPCRIPMARRRPHDSGLGGRGMNDRSLAHTVKKIVEMVRPDLSAYMRFPVQAEVTAVDIEHYTCDVQPLHESLPSLPACRMLSPWATATMRLVVLPAVGDQVLVGFENGDPDKPFILGFLPNQGPEGSLLIEAETARITIDQEGVVCIESDARVQVNAPQIDLGAQAVEAVIKGNTFQQLFNAHQHIGNQGTPTSTPVQPLDGSELSEVVKLL